MRRYKSTILAISTREKEVEKHSDAMLLELSEAKKENRSKNGFSFAIQYLLERWRNVLLHRVLVGKLTSLQESLTASEKKGNIVNTCTVCMNVGSVYANAYTYAMYSYNSCMYGRLYFLVSRPAYELELRNCELSASLQQIVESHKSSKIEHEAKEEEYRFVSMF